jgi:hypothetical protein
MDFQTRKLNAIGFLIAIENENFFNKIESAIMEGWNHENHNFKPFTQQQLIDRAKKANLDYLNGNFKSQELIEKESENW